MHHAKQFSILLILIAFALAFVGCKGEEKKGPEAPRLVAVKAEPVGKKLPEVAPPASPDAAKDLFNTGPGKLSFMGARNYLRGGRKMQITITPKPFFDSGFVDMAMDMAAKQNPESKAQYDAFIKASGLDVSKAIEGIGIFGDDAPSTVLVSIKQDITPAFVAAVVQMGKDKEKDMPEGMSNDETKLDAVYVLANIADGSAKAIKEAMEAEAKKDGVTFKHKKYDEATRVMAGLEAGDKNATGFYFWSGGVIVVDFPATAENLQDEAIKHLYPHVKTLDDISKNKDATAGGALPALVGRGEMMGGITLTGSFDIKEKTVLALEAANLGPMAKGAEEQYKELLGMKDKMLNSPEMKPMKGLLTLLIDGHVVNFGKDKISASITVDTKALKKELSTLEIPTGM